MRSNDHDENEIRQNEVNNDDDYSWTSIHEKERIPELKEIAHPERQSFSCAFDKKRFKTRGDMHRAKSMRA